MGLLEKLFGPKVPEMTPQEVAQAMKEGRVVVVDIRDARAYAQGHIAGGRHVPALHREIASLPKDKPIVVVCRSGRRSIGAARLLMREGFSSVYSMRGGMRAWEREGLPVERD